MMTYLLQASICWLFFLLVYQFFLRKETFFNNNRWYLLSTLCLGFLIPIARKWVVDWMNQDISYVIPFQGTAQLFEVSNEQIADSFHWDALIRILYWIGVLVSFGFLGRQLYSLFNQIKKYPKIQKYGFTKVITDYEHLPFSFFQYVFVSEKVKYEDPELQKILQHEVTHVHHWHSLDILLLECLVPFLWWNPLIYWYRRAVRDTHEYIADAFVLKSTDTEAYGYLLMQQSQSGLQLSLANHFIYSQLKNRIDMMLKLKSNPKRLWKYALIVPAIIVIGILFAYKNPEKHAPKSELPATETSADTIPQNIIYMLNDKQVHAGLVKHLDPSKIKQINVLKGESAITKYGDKGKSGVIEIDANVKISYSQPEMELFSFGSFEYNVTKGLGDSPDLIVVNFLSDKDKDLNLKSSEGQDPIKEKINNFNALNPDQSYREIFKVVEESPRFPGCENLNSLEEKKKCADEKMMQYLYTNIKYPQQARTANIQGRVVVSFIIEPDGSITGAEIVREIGGGCGAEALRVVNSMNNMPEKWLPGKQRGSKVAVQYNLPIQFKMNNDMATIPPPPPSSMAPAAVQKNETNNIPLISKSGGEVFKEVEELPRFPGCENLGSLEEKKKCAAEKMLQFLYKNVKYPLEAKDAGIQGKVVISFIVEPDGSIYNPRIINEIGGGCGAEALKVINLMNTMPEKWIPGKQKGKAVAVEYNLPIMFKLNSGGLPNQGNNQPGVFVVDGKFVDDAFLQKINPNDIKSMHVLKGESAIQKYGEKGKDGVIEIELKKDELEKKKIGESSKIQLAPAQNESKIERIKLIPNPANTKVEIQWISGENVKLEIYDISGKLVKTNQWNNFSGRESIDVSSFVRGTYIIKMAKGNITKEEKLILQ